MTPLLITFGVFVVLGLGAIIALLLRKPEQTTNVPDEAKMKEIAKLEKDLESALKEKNELSGKGKQMYDSFKNLEAEYKATLKERDNLVKTVNKYEAMQEQREKEHQTLVKDQKSMVTALEKERERVIQSELDARKIAEEERDRLWNDHENGVIAALVDLCKQPQFLFKSYSNTNLPDGFDGSLKPDFLIEFLDQYVIFDAKVSKAQSLQTYIDDAVKKTAEKIRKNGKIYPHVYLVVPTEAITELKKLVYAKDEFYFYIVSREALAPILASLKRISTYELAETLDPQKRENIINMLSELATHISYRNAHELLLTKMGADTLERVSRADPELASEVEQKSAEKKLSQLAPSEIKRLASSLTEQNAAAQQLASPKASVKKSMIDAAQTVMAQKLL